MKQTLLAVMVLLVCASCEQKPETIVDEICPQIPGIDPYLITEAQADTMIYRYHASLLEQAQTTNFDSLKDGVNLSFMLDANMLRDYLDSNQNFSMLDVYLAMDDEYKITLVYIGAVEETDPHNEKRIVYKEIPYIKAGDPTQLYLLDNARPCPTCPRLSLYTPISAGKK